MDVEDGEEVVKVEVASTNRDPAAQQQQSAAYHGPGEATVSANGPVSLESVFIGRQDGGFGGGKSSVETDVLLAARELLTGDKEVDVCAQFHVQEAVRLVGLSGVDASLNGQMAYVHCERPLYAPVNGSVTVRLESGGLRPIPVQHLLRRARFYPREKVRASKLLGDLARFNEQEGLIDSDVAIDVPAEGQVYVLFPSDGTDVRVAVPIGNLHRLPPPRGAAGDNDDGDDEAAVDDDDADTSKPIRIPLKRSATATNEYGNNRALLVGAFPCHFPLGQGPARDSTLATADSRHLLLQYNPIFGTHSPLHFLLFNQLQRHTGSSRLAAAVRGDQKSFREFKKLYENPDTLRDLDAAIMKPESNTSKVFVRKLQKIFKVSNALIPFSGAARKAQLGEFVAMFRHFGPAQFYNTIAPDPIGSPVCLRMTYPTCNNRDFPAKDDAGHYLELLRTPEHVPLSKGAFKDLKPHIGETDKGEIKRESHGDLNVRVTANPVACAEVYRQETLLTMKHIYGMPEEAETKASLTRNGLEEQKCGIHGHARSIISVNECNGKGWMHNHALICAGQATWLIQYIAGFSGHRDCPTEKELKLKKALGEYVDACVRAELEPTTHKQSLLRRLLAMKPYPAPWHVAKLFDSAEAAEGGALKPSEAKLTSHVQFSSERTNCHTHGERCLKGDWGKVQCAQCYAQTERDDTTATQLLRIPGDVFEYDKIEPIPKSNDDDGKMSHMDHRVIVIEPKRRVIARSKEDAIREKKSVHERWRECCKEVTHDDLSKLTLLYGEGTYSSPTPPHDHNKIKTHTNPCLR